MRTTTTQQAVLKTSPLSLYSDVFLSDRRILSLFSQLVDIIFSQLWQLSKPLFGWKARVQSDGWAATWKMASLCSIIITRRSVRSSNRNLWRASNALIGQLLPVASNQRFELLQLAGWPTNFSRYLEPPRRG